MNIPRTKGRRFGPACRGFGEKYGACTNPPRRRSVKLGSQEVEVPTLCASCENAFRENNRTVNREGHGPRTA